MSRRTQLSTKFVFQVTSQLLAIAMGNAAPAFAQDEQQPVDTASDAEALTRPRRRSRTLTKQ